MQDLVTVILLSLFLGSNAPAYCSSYKWTCKDRIKVFSLYFYEEAYDNTPITPPLLAAVARHESGMNPAAVSPLGAKGIMQLLPKYHKNVRFVRDSRYRRYCLTKVGACQRAVVRAAAKYLFNSYRVCKSLRRALLRYNTGSCGKNPKYAKNVLKWYKMYGK